MGTVIEFPVARRLVSTVKFAPLETGATVLILPVIRIERQTGETNGNSGPQEGTAPGRRRRRR
jgi:hypothetical protein